MSTPFGVIVMRVNEQGEAHDIVSYLNLDSAAQAQEMQRHKVGEIIARQLMTYDNFAISRSHRLVVAKGKKDALVIIETCLEPPCPWMGDDRDQHTVRESIIWEVDLA